MNNFNVTKNEFSVDEIVSDLRRQMAENGIACDQEILIDGKIHRFSRDHKQNQPDEWYVAFEWFSSKNVYYLIAIYGSWSDDSKFVFRSWGESERFFNEKERLEIQEALQKRQKEAEKLIEEEHKRAAETAQEIWDKSETIAPDEKYLAYSTKKGIQPIGARFTKNPQGYPSLVIPLYNLEGEIRSLQFISVGEGGVYKTFLSGGEKKGNFMALGSLKDQGQFLVAEGYATACSCHEATGIPTVVAFDSGNLPLVIRKLREKFPKAEITICGDNDSHRENNPGKNAAIKAAIGSGCSIAIPWFCPEKVKDSDQQVLTDFNDLQCLNGHEEVASQIEATESALNFLLNELAGNPLDKTRRDYIFSIAYQAVAKGDLSQKDTILSQLHEILKPLGIEKMTLKREFKQFIEEQGDQASSFHFFDSANLDEKEERLINVLMDAFGHPIPFNHNGKPKGINQMFFASKFTKQRNILYEPVEHAFHEYHPESGLWEYKTDDYIKIRMGEEAIRFLRKLGFEDLVSLCTETLLKQLIALVKGNAEQLNAFQRKRGIIHVANGIIELNENSNILHEFSPEYYSRNRSNIAVDPYANCPRFIHDLLVPAISKEDISLLQRYCGQCLLGYNPSQTILLMPGTAGGGKSTVVSVIEKVIGIYNVAQLKVNHLSERFEVVSFFGKTLLTGKDVPGNFLHNPHGANVLKSLVGGDRLSAEQKNFRKRFDIIGEFNVIITSNARLHLRLDSDIGAWQRRLLIIEFQQSPPKKPIPHFDDLLVNTEGPGILNWMIEGAKLLLHELEVHGRIQRSSEQIKRVDDLLAESDSIVAFVQNCIEGNQGGDVTVSELSEAYTSFCQQRDWHQESITSFQSQVKNVMLQLHHVSLRHDILRNSKNQRGFKHVSLINQEGE